MQNDIRRSLASNVFVSLTGLCPLRMGVIFHLLPSFLILLRSPCEFYTRQNRLYVGMLNRFVSFERPFYHFSWKIRSPLKLLQDIARPSCIVTWSQTGPQSISSDLGHTNVPSRMILRSVHLIWKPSSSPTSKPVYPNALCSNKTYFMIFGTQAVWILIVI